MSCNKWFDCGDYGCLLALGGMEKPSRPNGCKWLLVPLNKISGDIIPDSKELNIQTSENVLL